MMERLFSFLFLLASTADGEGLACREMKLHKVNDPYTHLWSLPDQLTTYYDLRSMTECASRCLDRYNSCGAITFDAENTSCVLGSCAISKLAVRSLSVDLYQIHPALCSSTPGFNVETNRNTIACLWWSDTQKNFTDARMDCLAKGAILATFKTYEKFEILKNRRARIFIGLDDMEVEGTFKWHDDNSILDKDYIKQVFQPGDPNDGYGTEDCVSLFEISDLLVDIQCSALQLYVCEKMCYT